jgi:oligoribonuclease
MLKYISLDIETTGLNPETCDIVEIGAVFDDLETPLSNLKQFHTYVMPTNGTTFTGEPYALSMHSEIFKRIAKKQPPYEYAYVEEVVPMFISFLDRCGYDAMTKIVPAGKNYASFDSRFLSKLPKWGALRFHHRTLDPMMFYVNKNDIAPPDLSECCKRAGIANDVKHTAVEDALMVVELIRKGLQR